jgi:hypothetical protein
LRHVHRGNVEHAGCPFQASRAGRRLKGYAGHWFQSDADWRSKRQAIIDRWTACEQALQQIDAYEIDPDATIEALKKAKGFDPDKVAYGSTTWRALLFPTS